MSKSKVLLRLDRRTVQSLADAMYEPKPWYHSKTHWATLFTIAASVLSVFDIHFDSEVMAEIMTQPEMITLITGLVALYGNAVRKQPIDWHQIFPGFRIGGRTPEDDST